MADIEFWFEDDPKKERVQIGDFIVEGEAYKILREQILGKRAKDKSVKLNPFKLYSFLQGTGIEIKDTPKFSETAQRYKVSGKWLGAMGLGLIAILLLLLLPKNLLKEKIEFTPPVAI